MNRSDFGMVLQALRKETRNLSGMPMTQSELADLTKVPLITIQKIEQGRQANLRPEVILDLANGLNIPTHARQDFFLASLGLKDSDLVREFNHKEGNLGEIISLMDQLPFPGFVTNCFGDLILVNPCYLSFLNITLDDLKRSRGICKYNTNRLFFSPEFSEIHNMMGDSYSKFAQRRILIFKAATIKYRNHWYYKQLMTEMNQFPKFRYYWHFSEYSNEDVNVLVNCTVISHPRWGQLSYISFPVEFRTREINLFIYFLQPMDEHTALTSIQMTKECGNKSIKVCKTLVPANPLDI